MNEEENDRIRAEAFAKKYREGQLNDALVLDVREEEEWQVYHLKEALLIPLQRLPFELGRLSREKNLYVLCAHGVRSVHAVHLLYGQGFQRVVNVDGGLAEVSLYLEEGDLSSGRN
ncbi:rhodanese-like domain-containing protein [Paludifilum halophilum]|uniref:Rhodanese domain-containing protein n=1 Tax=Paludifilum halophilum TaxID=1642702 RepID=A0A235BBR1_9BACL|nr:rhodanese-like domain-containing protein [Paludifilum halophilum]OYD09748.1 hypothetical protein CHM34_01775 [Paludifilum halophilum]